MRSAKPARSVPHGWLAIERPQPPNDPELSEGDDPEEELCEATIVRLDASALEALFQKARSLRTICVWRFAIPSDPSYTRRG